MKKFSNYSFVCKICGAFKIGKKEEVAEFGKHHRIKVDPPTEHLQVMTMGEKPKFRMCPVKQVIDVEKRQITYARPDLAKFLNKERKKRREKHGEN